MNLFQISTPSISFGFIRMSPANSAYITKMLKNRSISQKSKIQRGYSFFPIERGGARVATADQHTECG